MSPEGPNEEPHRGGNAKRLKKLLLIGFATLMLVGGVQFYQLWVDQQAKAERSSAYGRLSQMRLALQAYEHDHGMLPALSLRDMTGKPVQSWRSLMLPYLGDGSLAQFDLSQPWNSPENLKRFADTSPIDWVWFARSGTRNRMPVSTHVFAYLGPESIWDAATCLPKVQTQVLPNSILLLSVPKSDCHPLRPCDLTEADVRERVRAGQDVWFIMAGTGHSYGRVSLERGELKFTLELEGESRR